VKLVALRDFSDGVGTKTLGQVFESDERFGRRLIAHGMAAVEAEAPTWCALQWPGATVVILASGPSLTVADCTRVQAWRDGDIRRAIAINTTFRMAPWADALYGCDARWWQLYHAEVERTFRGALWSQDELAKRLGVNHIRSENARGLGKKPGVIHQGGNSGYQAVNLAYQAGAKRIVLLGFDMRDHGTKTHHHADHPTGLNTQPNYAQWIADFNLMARELRGEGVDVVNATPGSALTCFPMAKLEDALA